MKSVLGALSFLICGVIHGQETTINVLAVELPPGNLTSAITQQMADLASHWPNPNGVTVTLVNGGVPVYLGAPIGSGDAESQLNAAKAGLEATNLRGTADIVIFFSPYPAVCGHADMDNWNTEGRHAFIPNGNGLDLDGADIYYGALVSPPACPGWATIHEFGHLFSAGHAFSGVGAEPYGSYLLQKNHAWYWTHPTNPSSTMSQKTIMTQGGIPGTQMWIFSPLPQYNTDNLTGLGYTALSLANYRTGFADAPSPPDQCSDGLDNDGNGQTDYPADTGCTGYSDNQEYGGSPSPGCLLEAPVVVSGVLTGVCVPSYPYTSHLLSWIDVCPTAATHYQVWYNQFGSYVFGWNTPIPINNVVVWGANAEIKIKSCNGPVCTGRSSDSYYAVSGC